MYFKKVLYTYQYLQILNPTLYSMFINMYYISLLILNLVDFEQCILLRRLYSYYYVYYFMQTSAAPFKSLAIYLFNHKLPYRTHCTVLMSWPKKRNNANLSGSKISQFISLYVSLLDKIRLNCSHLISLHVLTSYNFQINSKCNAVQKFHRIFYSKINRGTIASLLCFIHKSCMQLIYSKLSYRAKGNTPIFKI